MATISVKSQVGINGIGRIGKLLVWLLATRGDQKEIVISTGREVGTSIEDLAAYFSYDSTYGSYTRFAFGFLGEEKIAVKDGALFINGMKIIWLNKPDYRIPGVIPWSDYGVELVFDTTGKMTDPTINEDKSLRGHLHSAKKVIVSAPFKIKKKGTPMPDDAVTLVGGVNFDSYDPAKHHVISNASCTTNCCAPAIKALAEHFGTRMISYALTTVHAATNSQSVLDTVPKAGDSDTRKQRMTLNNMIPTSTGAAKAVLEVIPEIRDLGIGSQASSIRVPTTTGSIVILDVSLLGEFDDNYIHDIFRNYSKLHPDIMKFSDKQLVSTDIMGSTHSTIYDSLFTHRRTSKRENELYTMVDMNFWYDNEFGYVNALIRLYDLVTGKR